MSQYQLPHKHGEHRSEIINTLLHTKDLQLVSSIFKLLSDPSRLRIFWLLCHHEECVINISALMNMSSPAVAHHLKLLKDSGLLEYRRDGKEVYYKAAASETPKALHTMIETMIEISCPKKETPDE